MVRDKLILMNVDRYAYRFALVTALVSTLVLMWLSAGVGIIGADGDPANRMYLGVVAVGIVGSLIARFRSKAMAVVLVAMAIVQMSIAAIALIGRLGLPYSGPAEIILLNTFFAGVFLGSAWLFRRAAGERVAVGAS